MNREEVIKGLECCIITPNFCRDDCPYIGKGDENDYCDAKLFKDALALLKAQEPRVITLEELAAIGPIWEYDTPPYLWLDTNPSLRNTAGYWCAWCIIHDLLEGQHVIYAVENYGTGWRCWTSRPTDEQREATPWP